MDYREKVRRKSIAVCLMTFLFIDNISIDRHSRMFTTTLERNPSATRDAIISRAFSNSSSTRSDAFILHNLPICKFVSSLCQNRTVTTVTRDRALSPSHYRYVPKHYTPCKVFLCISTDGCSIPTKNQN